MSGSEKKLTSKKIFAPEQIARELGPPNNEEEKGPQLSTELFRVPMESSSIRETEERYRQLVELSPDAILVHTKGGVVYMNAAGAALFGATTAGELVGKPILDLIHPPNQELVKARIKKIDMEGAKTPLQEYQIVRLDGEVVHIEATGTLITYQGQSANLVIIRDISARKQAEQKLKALNERLREEQTHREDLSKRLIDLLEQDRREVAMELHDRIGQMLTTLKLDLEIISSELKSSEPPIQNRIGGAVIKTSQTITDLKKIAYGLMPSMIENLGLVPSFRALLAKLTNRTGIKIHFFSKGLSERFDREKELAIYRVAQETFNNILKHARAKHVFVNLIKNGQRISMSIEDDGVGFEVKEKMRISRTGGPLGLHIMRERIAQLRGEFSIESRIGGGTHLLAEIPL